MQSANDQTAMTSNTKHSVALSLLGGEYVLSAFAIVDGEVDTDREIIFQTFTDAMVARRAYGQTAALLTCDAAAFDRAIGFVHYCRTSLQLLGPRGAARGRQLATRSG